VNETNSSAPDTEVRIAARDSYGRQLGQMLDAPVALISERPEDSPPVAAFQKLEKLKNRIDATKDEAATSRLNRICDDLLLPKEEKPNEYDRHVASLEALLTGRVG
jgi:hypothetical protein